MAETARLQKHYREVVRPKLRSELGLASDMQVPRITKITINMGVGEAVADKKVMDAATGDLARITGQKPAVRKSKKAVATFKIREGLPVGCMVTLRGARMYEFLDRLINVAMPRIRDFRGVQPALVRRPGQLQLRRQGTDHFPRDRIRPDRPGPGHGHHDYDLGGRRQAWPRAARGVQLSVQEVTDG